MTEEQFLRYEARLDKTWHLLQTGRIEFLISYAKISEFYDVLSRKMPEPYIEFLRERANTYKIYLEAEFGCHVVQ